MPLLFDFDDNTTSVSANGTGFLPITFQETGDGSTTVQFTVSTITSSNPDQAFVQYNALGNELRLWDIDSMSNSGATDNDFTVAIQSTGGASVSLTGTVANGISLNLSHAAAVTVRFLNSTGSTLASSVLTGAGAGVNVAASVPMVHSIQFTTSNGAAQNFLTVNSISANGVTCFAAGTRIATPEGFALVEELAEGDVISTPEGTTTVRWVGRREVDPRLTIPARVNPICIAEGAFGNTRDLMLSPDHAVLVDGVLVNASALVNGSTIRQVACSEPFTYYHVETHAHELILAEGVPCESYLPERQEFAFDNEATRPAREIAEMDLPRITSARLVPKREAA